MPDLMIKSLFLTLIHTLYLEAVDLLTTLIRSREAQQTLSYNAVQHTRLNGRIRACDFLSEHLDYHHNMMVQLTPHFRASLAFLMPLLCVCVCERDTHTYHDR